MRRQIKIRGKGNVKKQTPTSSKLNASVQNKRPVFYTSPSHSSISQTRFEFKIQKRKYT